MNSRENTSESPEAAPEPAHFVEERAAATAVPLQKRKRRTSPPSPMLMSALALADAGLRVIPLRERSKKPRLRAWVEKATMDGKTIKRWFKRNPDSNLGICTGGGVIVLDVDPKNGGDDSLARLIDEHGPLPATAEVFTGSGGSHYFFRVGPDLDIRNRTGFMPGLDIRGERGQVVAPPSIHPGTGRAYEFVRHPSEGIAPAPEWLIALLTPPARTGEKPAERRPGMPKPSAQQAGPGSARETGPPTARPPANNRQGEVAPLVAEMMRRFPIFGRGQRYNLMVKLVGRLVGHGYQDRLIEAVGMAWWRQFSGRGTTGTGEQEMRAELWECIRSTRNNPRFAASSSGIDHRASCRAIRLNEGQKALLGARVVTDELGSRVLQLDLDPDPIQGDPSPTCKRVTQEGEIETRLCSRDDERYFVEALIVHATHKLVNTTEVKDGTIKMAHHQLREIMQDRHPRGEAWKGDNTQFERLKRRYVTRPGRPAERFELLRETLKGWPGVPSQYQITGLSLFLELATGQGAAENLVA